MSKIQIMSRALLVFGLLLAVPAAAEASCVKKAARATAGSESSAKWFAMETIVQQVSWGLWPGWVVTGELPGYTVKKKFYKCKPEGSLYNCFAQATICKK